MNTLELLKTLIEVWAAMWPMWLFILIAILVKAIPVLYENWQLQKAGMPEIDRMTGLQFEKFLEMLFRRLGYQVERTPYAGDYGGDLVLIRGKERILVQAKRWNKAVGIKAVQEAAAARPHYRCHRAIVVTNRHFTKSARELAASNQVDLWDRRKLAEVINAQQLAPGKAGAAPASPTREAAATAQSHPLASTPASTPAPAQASPAHAHQAAPRSAAPPTRIAPPASPPPPPTCRRCGKPMVLRKSARGEFWGCSGFPACRNTMPYRGSNST